MKVFISILISVTLFGCSTSSKIGHVTKTWDEVSYTTFSDMNFGIPVYDRAIVTYKRAGKTLLKVKLGEPAIIGVAMNNEVRKAIKVRKVKVSLKKTLN